MLSMSMSIRELTDRLTFFFIARFDQKWKKRYHIRLNTQHFSCFRFSSLISFSFTAIAWNSIERPLGKKKKKNFIHSANNENSDEIHVINGNVFHHLCGGRFHQEEREKKDTRWCEYICISRKSVIQRLIAWIKNGASILNSFPIHIRCESQCSNSINRKMKYKWKITW